MAEKENKPEHHAHSEDKITIKLPKIKFGKVNVWLIVSLVLAIVLVMSVIFGWTISDKSIGIGKTLSAAQAGQKTLDYVNKNLVQAGTSATFVSIKDLGSVYEVTSSYQSRDIPIYISKDGSFLFLSAYNTSETIETEQTQETPQEIPKTDKPTVQLFVMSFCPYGIQAEQAMKPVVDLLGSKVTIEPHFIVSVSGTTVNSLHGEYEANEDMRQACIWKNYNQATFWKYLDYLNSNCNKNNLDTCWKDAAKNASVTVSKIETCQTSEGLDLMKAEEALSTKNGVSGSPTLIINGVVYSGARTAEAYKQAICNATTTPPAECSQTLSSAGSTTTSGGCG